MKKFILSLIVCSICVSFLILSCDNHEMPRYASYSAYEYSRLDEDGGSWTPVLLSSGSEISVDPPADVNSAEYKAELNKVKEAQASLTKKQKDAVKYWTNNPVVRWNEIALELAAKYNLIPGPNPDGTY